VAEELVPLVIAIGGSDPRAGAGIQADAEMAARMGAQCFAVSTMHTEQGPDGLATVELADPSAFAASLNEAVEVQSGRRSVAIKTGALGNLALLREVLVFLRHCPTRMLVVDPIRRASRARPGVPPLLDDEAWAFACTELLPRAQLVTPNLREWPDLRPEQWGRALRKGGHRFDADGVSPQGRGARQDGASPCDRVAIDELVHGEDVLEVFQQPWIDGAESLHGTGCRLASAFAVELARTQALAGELKQATLVQAIAAARAAFADWMREASRSRA